MDEIFYCLYVSDCLHNDIKSNGADLMNWWIIGILAFIFFFRIWSARDLIKHQVIVMHSFLCTYMRLENDKKNNGKKSKP